MNLIPDQAGLILQLVRFFLVLVVGIVLTRGVAMPIVRRMFDDRADKRTAETMQNLVGIIGFVTVFVIALQAGNFGNLVTIVGAIAAALTVAVGFGIRDQINNLVGGIFLHLDPPFLRDDYISVNEYRGRVREIKLRTTTLDGSSSEKLVVPNSVLTLNPVRSFTKGEQTKISLQGKATPDDLAKITSVFLQAAKDTERVLKSPEPKIVHTDFDEKVVFELQCWIRDAERVHAVRDAIIERIIERGNEDQLFVSDDSEEE